VEHMLTVTANNPLAAGAGLVAMACLAAWPLFRTRSTMLIVYIGNNIGFIVHYALLDQWTAVAMNGLIAAQTVVAIWLVRWPRLRLAYYALMPVMAVACWQGLSSLLSSTATTLSTLGRMQRNETMLRLLLLTSTPFWAAHDLIVGSLPGLVADLLSMATGTTMLLWRSSPSISPRSAV
jgi:Bacterial inner membrane protein